MNVPLPPPGGNSVLEVSLVSCLDVDGSRSSYVRSIRRRSPAHSEKQRLTRFTLVVIFASFVHCSIVPRLRASMFFASISILARTFLFNSSFWYKLIILCELLIVTCLYLVV